MLIEVAPFISAYATLDQMEEAIQKYPEVYLGLKDGYLKHIRLSGGRYVRLKLDKLPDSVQAKLGLSPAPNVGEEINFLPAGKIPIAMWNQIVEFFREVSKKFKSDYEAQVYILWSKERGYFIHVPKQEVSKASVRFDYDKPEGSIIVVDCHSHNTMGRQTSDLC